jgi:hypothetical protein
MALITNCHLSTEIRYLYQPFLSENWFKLHSFNSMLSLSSSNFFQLRDVLVLPVFLSAISSGFIISQIFLILLLPVKTLIIISSQEDTLQIFWYWIRVRPIYVTQFEARTDYECSTAHRPTKLWSTAGPCQYCSFRLLGLYSVAIILKTKHMGKHVKTI